MGRKKQILLSPLFILSIIILLVNDLYLKQRFHNFITGKLSDFAGLFAFTLFCISLFPKCKKHFLLIIPFIFLLWKSPWSQPLIDLWSSYFYPIGRTVDYSDLIAIPAVWLAYRYSYSQRKRDFGNYMKVPIGIIALFAFCATSYIHVYKIDKSFEINLPKEEVVNRLNSMCNGCGNYTPLSVHTSLADTTFVDYNGDTVCFSVKGYRYYSDTMWNYSKSGEKIDIDTIRQYRFMDADTMYLSKTGFFNLQFDIKEFLQQPIENSCDCISVRCRITEKGNNTLFTIHSTDARGCYEIKSGEKGTAQLIEAFDRCVKVMMKP